MTSFVLGGILGLALGFGFGFIMHGVLALGLKEPGGAE